MYRVIATSLNLRSSPTVAPKNKLAVLPQGQEVEKLDGSKEPWWFVETNLGGNAIQGYVHSQYLVDGHDAAHEVVLGEHDTIPAVHLAENNPAVTRSADGKRAYPLGENSRPFRDNGLDPQGKAEQLTSIIEWLDVESSKRYQRTSSATYCNIYACDYCYLAGAYLPRVWWTQKALLDLTQGHSVTVSYGGTVTELNANSLHDWLVQFGADFGWQRTFSYDDAQAAANQGRVVVVCAKRVTTNSPGHICVIAPETEQHIAQRKGGGGSISVPLQSQAGSSNYRYRVTNLWWTSDQFQSFGIWIHD